MIGKDLNGANVIYPYVLHNMNTEFTRLTKQDMLVSVVTLRAFKFDSELGSSFSLFVLKNFRTQIRIIIDSELRVCPWSSSYKQSSVFGLAAFNPDGARL